MGKQKHRSESREIINFHRLGNMGQILVKMNEQLDFLQAILLMNPDERAIIRKNLEEQDGQDLSDQDSGAREESGNDSEQAGDLGEDVSETV